MVRSIGLAAFLMLGACAGMPGAGDSASADAKAEKSVLDRAIAAAGGQEALGKVKELEWTGTATINAGGKTTEVLVDTIVRPYSFARSTSWPKDKGEMAGKTVQAEMGKAWAVTRSSWDPMPEAQAQHELQQFALYGAMLLTPLKDPAVKVTETAPGKDGTRNLHVEHPKGPPMDLHFNRAGKLIRITDSVRDPAGGATPIPQVIELSGEVVSNGVKWPKRISIKQNDLPYFDLQIEKFEARTTFSLAPIKHTLDTDDRAPNEGRPSDAG